MELKVNICRIDCTNYMNSKFVKYLKLLDSGNPKEREKTLNELHSTFATLSQDEQKHASIFLHDIERGDVVIDKNKTLRDYITQYQVKAKSNQISKCAIILGLDESKLRHFMSMKITMNSINEYGRFDELKAMVNTSKAKEYFERKEKTKLSIPKVHIKIDEFLRRFIYENGFEIDLSDEN